MITAVDGVARSPEPIPGARLLFSLDPAVSHLNHGSFGAVPIAGAAGPAAAARRDGGQPAALLHPGPGRPDRAHPPAPGRRSSAPTPTAPPWCPTPPPAVELVLQLARPAPRRRGADHRPRLRRGAASPSSGSAGAPGRRRARSAVPLAAGDDEVVGPSAPALRPGRTRLLVIDHSPRRPPELLPVAAVVGAALRERGVPVLVDAAHAPGHAADRRGRASAPTSGSATCTSGRSRRAAPPLLAVAAAAAGPDRAAGGLLGAARGLPARRSSSPARSTTPPGWPRRPACSPAAQPRTGPGPRAQRRARRVRPAGASVAAGSAVAPSRPARTTPGGDPGEHAAGPAAAGRRHRPGRRRWSCGAGSPTELAGEVALDAWHGRGLPAAVGPALQPGRRTTTGWPSAAGAARQL